MSESQKGQVWAWLVSLSILGLLVFIAVLANRSGVTRVAIGTTATTSAKTTTMTTVEPTTTPPPTTTTVAESRVQPSPVEFVGSGNGVVEFTDELIAWLDDNLALISYRIENAPAAQEYSIGLAPGSQVPVFSGTGEATGTALLGASTRIAVELEEGDWQIVVSPITSISPPSDARDFYVQVLDTTGTYLGAQTEVTGRAPDVLILRTEGITALEVIASGTGLIRIWYFSLTTSTGGGLAYGQDDVDETALVINCDNNCVVQLSGVSDTEYEYTIRIKD